MSIHKGDNAKVKEIIKESKDILQEDTSSRLFGEKFDDKITEFCEAQEEIKRVLQHNGWEEKGIQPCDSCRP